MTSENAADEVSARAVVDFWRAAGREKWFNGGRAFDAECKARFENAHLQAAAGALTHWLDTADGALALVLLLDQMPRNIWRGTAHAFATDALARIAAQAAIDAGIDAMVAADLRGFFYLPFEHSEAPADQAYAVQLFTALGDATQLQYALAHQQVIAQFGRFPHRNAALGRQSTPAEQDWLAAGGGF